MQLLIVAQKLVLTLENIDWALSHGVRAKMFIDELKALVPAECREYNPEEHTWYIDKEFVDAVRQLRKRIFDNEKQETLFNDF